MAGYDPDEETNPFLYQANNNTHHHHIHSSRPVYSAGERSGKPHTHHFCSSFFFKLLIVGTLLSLLPLLSPSHAPDFISHHTILAKTWELLELLLVGILVSYGLFGRPIGANQTTQAGKNYAHDVSHNPSIFTIEREIAPGRCGGRGNESPFAGFRGEESVFVVRPGVSDVDYELPLGLPVRSLKSRVVESDDDEEFACGGYESDDIASSSTRYSEEIKGENVGRNSVVSFSSGDSSVSRQVGYDYFSSCSPSYPCSAAPHSPVMNTEEHLWKTGINMEPATGSLCKEDTRAEAAVPGCSPYVNLRSRSTRMASLGGFSSVCLSGDRHEPSLTSAPFSNIPIEEVGTGLGGGSWKERPETESSSPGFPKSRSVRMDFYGEVVGDPSSFEGGYYCESEVKQAWGSSSSRSARSKRSSPLRSPSSLSSVLVTETESLNKGDVELENAWIQVPKMEHMSTHAASPTSWRTKPMMSMDYEAATVAGKDYSSCSSASSGEDHQTDSSRVVFSDAFSGSSRSRSDSRRTTMQSPEMGVELWRRNAMKLSGDTNSGATNELPSFSQWISPEQGNAFSSSNGFGVSSLKPKEGRLSDNMQRGKMSSDASTASSTVTSMASDQQDHSFETSTEFEEDESSLKEEMERLSRMVKQLKNNDTSFNEMEKEDLDRKEKRNSGFHISVGHDSNSSTESGSGIVLDDKLLVSKTQAGEGSLSALKNGRKALARRRPHSRRFSCGSFLDKELWKSSASDELKYRTVKGKADTANNSKVQAGLCGGWDCLKPPVMNKNSPRGKSVRTLRPSGDAGTSRVDSDSETERQKNDDDNIKVEVSASEKKTGPVQDVVVISIGVKENNTSAGTPNVKVQSIKDRKPEKSCNKGGKLSGRANVMEEMDTSNAEIDRKAGEFIAMFKEQMRLQKLASRRGGANLS